MRFLPDLLAISGVGILTYGLSLFSLPLALSVLGVLLIIAGYLIQWNSKPEQDDRGPED